MQERPGATSQKHDRAFLDQLSCWLHEMGMLAKIKRITDPVGQWSGDKSGKEGNSSLLSEPEDMFVLHSNNQAKHCNDMSVSAQSSVVDTADNDALLQSKLYYCQ